MATGQVTTGKHGTVAVLSQLPGIRECLQWFTREKQWISEQHLQLCRIPAPTFLEQKRAAWMAEQFRVLGWKAEIDRAGNVVATADPHWRGPLIAVTAHLDTVLSPRSREDIMVDPDGRLRGPGVSDNGAGLAALLALARAIRSSPGLPEPQAAPVLIANVAEEGEGNLNGMRYLCGASPLAPLIRTFLVLDGPATDHITCKALAIGRYEVSFSGPGGHSWSDYGTANPNHALARAIALFTDEYLSEAAGAPRSSFNFGIMEGGTSINAIPTTARAKADLRSEEESMIGLMADLLTNCVERARETTNARASSGRLTAKIREIGSRPAGGLRPDAPVLRYLRAVDSHLGIRARLDCASTDANIPLSLGLQAASIGAGGEGGGAHTPSEWYHPEGRDLGLKRIFLALCLLMLDTGQPAQVA